MVRVGPVHGPRTGSQKVDYQPARSYLSYLGQVFAVSTRAVFTRGNYLSLQAHSVWVIILRRWVSTQPNLEAVITPLLRDGA